MGDAHVFGAALVIPEGVKLAEMPIAAQVQRHVTASFYAIQLAELEEVAKGFGYFFAQADTAAIMPPVLFDRLAYALEDRREFELYPNMLTEERQRRTSLNMKEGYAPGYLRAILEALDSLGLRLQESPVAAALIASEESIEREEKAHAQALIDAIVKGFEVE